MTERTGDFEFDFFDEPETEEDQSSRPREPRRLGPRRPVRPPSGFVPILRLVGLIAFAIALIVVLATVVSDCTGSSKAAPYRDYMQPLRQLAQDSEQVGRELNVALTTPGIEQEELAQQQQQGVTQARDLDPPAKLRAEHQRAIEALELRVSGVNRLVDTLRQ